MKIKYFIFVGVASILLGITFYLALTNALTNFVGGVEGVYKEQAVMLHEMDESTAKEVSDYLGEEVEFISNKSGTYLYKTLSNGIFYEVTWKDGKIAFVEEKGETL